jgi:deoxyribodipyrimidine photolyase-related protein
MYLIILPNQLFPIKMIKSLFDKNIKVFLIEEPRYFTDFRFHKLKLVYHRASMKKYEQELKNVKIKTEYIDFNKNIANVYDSLNKESTYYFNPIDHILDKKLSKLLSKAQKLDNLNFLLTPDEIKENKNIFYKNNKYSHNLFYKFQRKKLNILIKNNDQPIGNKWSYDIKNRLALPNNIKISSLPKIKKDKYYNEAKIYVENNFSKNYGSIDEWIYPIDNKTAIKWLNHFLVNKLNNFGPYQDAVNSNHNFIFHSVISPMMNIGILPDKQVIEIVTKYYDKNKSKISLQSYEGFIRQIIGWRNYVYAIYLLEPDMYKQNFLNHKNKISDKYWLGNTEIKPIDTIINKIIKYSYAHHIERLMYLGNWFLLNKVDPKEVHRIFMEWTIDAYDWVMVPNVMGMSQYADGGMMTTRIYFSSSNYIKKLSDNKCKDKWCEIWDAKYYAFINDNYKLLSNNYATARQVVHWKKKSEKEKENLLILANKNINL